MMNDLSQVHGSDEDLGCRVAYLLSKILRPAIAMERPVPQNTGDVSSRTALFGILGLLTAIIMDGLCTRDHMDQLLGINMMSQRARLRFQRNH